MKWALVLLVVAEFVLFDRMTSQNHAWIYPRWHQQNESLRAAYAGYEHRQTHGLWEGLGHTLSQPAAGGSVHSAWALLIFEFAGGPSRSAALAVNMLAFLSWQAAFFLAITRSFRSVALGWLAVGLTLALTGPWSGLQGSAVDFRIDQVSMGLMGLALAAALASEGFRSRTWSVVFGLAVGLTTFTHFLAGTYFAVIFAACLAWTLRSEDRRARALNLFLAAAVAAALIGPRVWFNGQEISGQSWIGHLLRPDELLGISPLPFGTAVWAAVAHLGIAQLGTSFALAGGIALAPLASAIWLALPSQSSPNDVARSPWPTEAMVLGTVFTLAPVLTLAALSSPLPVGLAASAAVPGVILLVVAFTARLQASMIKRHGLIRGQRWLAAAAVIGVVIGGGYFVGRQLARDHDEAFVSDVRRVRLIADKISQAAQRHEIDRPRITVDHVADYLNATTLDLVGYERHGKWASYVAELPTGVAAMPEPQITEHLENSDFVILTLEGPAGPWPFDQQMAGLRPKLRAWCEDEMAPLDEFTLFGKRFVIYQRRDFAPPAGFPERTLGSTQADYTRRLNVARRSARYEAKGLPPGLTLDPTSGWVRGRPRQAGKFKATLTATNADGATTGEVLFQIEEAPFSALAQVSAKALTGLAVEVEFEALDAGGKLDFVDVTGAQSMVRIPAGAGDRRKWRGRAVVNFAEPGDHRLQVRFVRYDPAGEPKYTFIDQFVDVSVPPVRPEKR
jgi:hypothetical protein